MSKTVDDSVLPVLLPGIGFSLSVWFYSLCSGTIPLADLPQFCHLGIFNTIPVHFHRFIQRLLVASCSLRTFTWGLPCHTLPGLNDSPNLGMRFCNFIHQVSSFMTLRSEARGWHCQVQLPCWEGAWLPWILFAAALICCSFLGIYKSIRLFLLKQKFCWVESCPEGTLPFIPLQIKPYLDCPISCSTNLAVVLFSSNCRFYISCSFSF